MSKKVGAKEKKTLLLPNKTDCSMIKLIQNIFKVLLIVACCFVPATLSAQDVQHNQIENEQNQVGITISNSCLRVKNAEGLVIEIFNLTGEKVYTQRIESSSKTIVLAHLQRGYYVVKIGNYTRKIYLH